MKNIRIPIPAIDFHPPVYLCKRATKPFILDGKLDKDFWADAPFTNLFEDIEGTHMPTPRFETRAKMLWDDQNLYIGAILIGNEIWGNVTQRDDVIFQDNDFEIFIDPDSDTQQYYEFEMNALNTVWDLFMPIAYRDGGSNVNCYDIQGLQTAVFVDGSINHAQAENKSWSVEVVIPFASLAECMPSKRTPSDGDYYRLNFSRVQWKVDVHADSYEKRINPATGSSFPEDNWVWSPTGVINIHYPELWGFLFFTEETTDPSLYTIPEDEYIKWEMRKLYYAEQISLDTTGHYTDSLDELIAILKRYSPSGISHTVKPLPYCIETTAHSFEISCPSSDGCHSISLFSNGKVQISGI